MSPGNLDFIMIESMGDENMGDLTWFNHQQNRDFMGFQDAPENFSLMGIGGHHSVGEAVSQPRFYGKIEELMVKWDRIIPWLSHFSITILAIWW